MLTLPPTVQIHIAVDPVDMRRSFDGLAATVRQRVGADPMSGHLFVFRNKRRKIMKILFWDRSGWVVLAKRLVKGTFRIPVRIPPGATTVAVEPGQLGLMMEGIDLRGAGYRKRWVPQKPGLRV